VVSHKEEIMKHFFLLLQESWVSIVGLQQNTYFFMWRGVILGNDWMMMQHGREKCGILHGS
jgi:hypothetical protein